MAKRLTAPNSSPPAPNTPTRRSTGGSSAEIARAAGILPELDAVRGREQEDDDELLLGVARLMLASEPPRSVSAAIETVLGPFIQERAGPKKDWRVRLDGKWLVYKGVEQRLRDRYEKDRLSLQERLVAAEAFRTRVASRVAAVSAGKPIGRVSGGRLSPAMLERLRTFQGELLPARDLDRYAEIVRSLAEASVKKKGSAPG
jgi:hypothetical protein